MIDVAIEDILPHRDRLKLLDRIVEVEGKRAVTESVVSEKWPLFNDNSVNPIIMVELVAQSTGIAIGCKKLKETGKGVFGWIVGVKQADFFAGEIALGTRLLIRVAPRFDDENYAVFEGSVENASNSEILCKVVLQVFSPV
ncbi:MAG: hypothetical protein V1874_08015 [Spirochaetota bacterium]